MHKFIVLVTVIYPVGAQGYSQFLQNGTTGEQEREIDRSVFRFL